MNLMRNVGIICLLRLTIKKKAAVILERVLDNNSYEVLPDRFIKIYNKLDEPQLINRALVENGVEVYSLERVGVNLEDYFVDLIGGEYNA